MLVLPLSYFDSNTQIIDRLFIASFYPFFLYSLPTRGAGIPAYDDPREDPGWPHIQSENHRRSDPNQAILR